MAKESFPARVWSVLGKLKEEERAAAFASHPMGPEILAAAYADKHPDAIPFLGKALDNYLGTNKWQTGKVPTVAQLRSMVKKTAEVMKKIVAEEARTAATEKARQAEDEKARLAADKAKKAEPAGEGAPSPSLPRPAGSGRAARRPPRRAAGRRAGTAGRTVPRE